MESYYIPCDQAAIPYIDNMFKRLNAQSNQFAIDMIYMYASRHSNALAVKVYTVHACTALTYLLGDFYYTFSRANQCLIMEVCTKYS